LQLGQCLGGDWTIHPGDAARCGVVEDDDLPVAREADVELVGVGMLRPGQPERCQRVFRRVVRSASMTDDFDARNLKHETHFVNDAGSRAGGTPAVDERPPLKSFTFPISARQRSCYDLRHAKVPPGWGPFGEPVTVGTRGCVGR
jgi:hypothetical protein